MRELLRRHLTKEPEEHARVEVAGTCAHQDAARRREAHRRIHRSPIAKRDQAAAAPEMSDDDARWQRRERCDDGLEGQPVKSVPPGAACDEAVGDGETPCDLGKGGVKGRVEAGDVRQVGVAAPGRGEDSERRRDVEWRELGDTLEARDERVVDEHGAGLLGPAVDDPVADPGDRDRSEGDERLLDRGGVIGRLDCTGHDAPLLATELVDPVLQRGRTAVQCEESRDHGDHVQPVISGRSSKCSRMYAACFVSMSPHRVTSSSAFASFR